MKTIRILFFYVIFPWSLNAQPCIDPTLIDSMAICPMVYNPVCGCDGVTYDNSCIATNLGGVTSWTPGPCNPPSCVNQAQIDSLVICPAVYQPVCGCDSITYNNDCEAFNYGGVSSWTPGPCAQNNCINPAQIDSLVICPAVYQPVCGCDSVTYNNDCEALNYGGVSSWTPGPCAQNNCINPAQIDVSVVCPAVFDPVCGCDSITYNNDCEAFNYGGVSSWTPGPCQPLELDTCLTVPDSVNFGACAMVLGIIRQNDSCFTVSGCSTIGSNGIDYSGYFFNSLYACTNLCANDTAIILDCIDTNLIDLSVLCPEIFEPVCGCDSVTYQNACIAQNYFGVSNYQLGACQNAALEWGDFSQWRLYPNPGKDRIYFGGLSDYSKVMFALLSTDGRILQQGIYTNGMDISMLIPGHYTVKISISKGQTRTLRLVRE